ncbi:MAG: tetratricopeptide repeat protein [Caldilineaceae bacterium]
MGVVLLYSGFVDEAQRLLHESLQLSRTTTSAMYLAWSYTYLAEAALWQGDLGQAAYWLAQALTYHANPRWLRTELVDCLWVAARLVAAQQQYRRAATSLGWPNRSAAVFGIRHGPMRPLNDAAGNGASCSGAGGFWQPSPPGSR